jgi:hypothetical protein
MAKSKSKMSLEAQHALRRLPRTTKEKIRQAKTRYSRNVCILEMRQMGIRPAIIGEIIGISESQVWRILKEKAEEGMSDQELQSVVKELEHLNSIGEGLFRAFREAVNLTIKKVIAQRNQ